MQTLRDITELGAVERIVKLLRSRRDVVCGAGDDCAVVRSPDAAGGDLLLTSDPVIEGVHFTRGTPALAVGHKAMGRVLSDIAAMGGEPLWALVDLVAPADLPVSDLDDLYAGMGALGDRHGMAVVGGDVSRGPALEVHVFGIGRCPTGTAVLRSGARDGDALFVTGTLGGSMQTGRHLSFLPRVKEGAWLRGRATAMMDVSDGLALDARRLAAASGVSVVIDAASLPVTPAVRDAADASEGIRHALCDGEDFELLFTVPSAQAAALAGQWVSSFTLPCTRIGSVTRGSGVTVRGTDGVERPLEASGYVHFG